jgi:hypothetical protein
MPSACGAGVRPCNPLRSRLKVDCAQALSCLDDDRRSRVIFDFAQVVGAVMSSAFCAD